MSKTPGKNIGQKVTIGYAWYALFVLFGINLFNYLDRLSIGPALEHIKRDFHVTDTKIGLIASAFMLTYAILSVPMGYLSDRTRRTRLVALGAFVWSIATMSSAFARRFWTFFFARALVGSGEGIYAPSGTAIVTDYFPKRMRTTAIAIFMSAMIVGGALAYIVAGVILKKTDRFDLPLVTGVLLDKGEKSVDGWNAKAVTETDKRLVQFVFESAAGMKVAAVLQNADEKKPADYHSKLFNVNYAVDGKPGAKDAPAEAAAFIATLNNRIAQREGRGLEITSVPLDEMPANLKIPAKYKDILTYQGNRKCLVFRGIMTKQDRMAIDKLSDNANFNKAVGEIYAKANYHYMRSDNWRWIFWILGPPGLIFAALAFFLKEPLKGGSEEFLSEEEAKAVEEAGHTNYWMIARTPAVVIMMLSNVFATYCVGALNIWLFPFVERYKGIPSADAAIKIGPIVVGFAVLGVIVSGILADKLQKRTPYGNNIVIVLAILCGTPFMYIFLYTSNYFVMMMSVSLCIFFLTWINGPQNSLLMSLVEPRLRAMLNGIHILLIHLLGDAISPYIVGYYSDKYNLRYALAMLPLFLVIGGIGFGLAAIFVPGDIKRMEQRMKAIAGDVPAKPGA